MPRVGAKPQPRTIETSRDIATGVRALRRTCPVFRQMNDACGSPPLRRRAAGLEGLLRIVVGQQLSVQSAAAIWARFEAGIDPHDAVAIASADDDALRALGLSRPKMRTIRAVADAVGGGLDLERLAQGPDEDVREKLLAITGIGPWTVDIFLMFCIGRADSFAAGDLALQVAAQSAFGLGERPTPMELESLADRWRPWRSVAALQLWHYYAHVKNSGAAEAAVAPPNRRSTKARPGPKGGGKMPV